MRFVELAAAAEVKMHVNGVWWDEKLRCYRMPPVHT